MALIDVVITDNGGRSIRIGDTSRSSDEVYHQASTRDCGGMRWHETTTSVGDGESRCME